MEKNVITVPGYVRFMSDWKEFTLPDYPCIVDKKIPGCGFTEYCIRNNEDLVLCSPRKLLLENKEDQHMNDVFYVKNEFDQDNTVDKDLEKVTRACLNPITNLYEINTEDYVRDSLCHLQDQIKNYIYNCKISGTPVKLLVTYDSFRFVKEVLCELGIINKFRVVIDEFQSIFTDSRFKASTEMEFLYHLQGISKLSYVSATPMIDKYLEQLDEFKDLPYFEFDWKTENPTRVLTPDLKVRICRGVNEPAYKIIQEYLNGNYESQSYRDEFGNIQTIYSKEVVFFVNSVTNILGIINKCDLKPEQCNVLIANTPDNKKKLKRRLGKNWVIGKVPLQGEPHKMFTFCTRTVYLGADFYSTCARTIVLSDANVDTLSVDISLDLPQILGRQRNNSNPWKNRAEFYYKTSLTFQNPAEFEKFIDEKLRRTDDLLRTHSITDNQAKTTLADKYKDCIFIQHYKKDYVGVNTHQGNILIPCLNKLVLLAERRAFDIQQIDYKDRFSVFRSLEDNKLIESETSNKISEFLETFNGLKTFFEKMRFLCESKLSENEIDAILCQIPLMYKTYYQTLGPSRCKANGYSKTELDKEISVLTFNKQDIKRELDCVFKEGEIYLLSDIKNTLKKIYESLGFKRTPKATDLSEYYEITRKQVNKKECFKIIKKL